MPVAIPSHDGAHRYHRSDESGSDHHDVSLADAFRSFADDLLESGDANLTLERAFRWGYHDEDGDHVAGLQEHLQDLRFQRDRLLRQIDDSSFLEDLAPELDRIDALDRASADPDSSSSVEGDQEDASTLDRLSQRLEEGYDSEEAQDAFEQLLGQLRMSAGGGAEPGSGDDSHGPAGTQAGQPGGMFGTPRAQAARRVMQMLFQGGTPSDESSSAGGGWRTKADTAIGSGDLALLRELEQVQEALDRIEGIGSVFQLSESDLAELAGMVDSGVASWLEGWRSAIDAVASSSGRPGVTPQVEVPPEVVSAIGRDLLRGLFNAVSSPVAGEHQTFVSGNAGDAADETIQWEFGRPLDFDLVATVSNAVRRGSRLTGGGLELTPGDFAVVERTARTAVSTVMAIDRSRSMGQSGAWTAAKKVAMAMHELIRQSYPRDTLNIVTFSSTAEPVGFNDIPELQWDQFEHGTHLQAALELGRVVHRRSPAGTRQIVVITDGEPTLATVGGEDVFASPPSEEILNATMAEVIRCTRENIVINIVMLNGTEDGSGFAEQIARVNQGRIFVATNESLGRYLLRDYVDR